jgi:type IV pilus assembly protein PilX
MHEKFSMPAFARRFHYPHFGSRRKQRGAVLLVALVFLLLLTMFALSATSRSMMQERMAGGLRNAQQAEMSAETALRGAEWQLWSSTSQVGGRLNCLMGSVSSDDGCTIYNPSNPPYTATGPVTKFLTSQGWVPDVGRAYKGPSGLGGYVDNGPGKQLANNPVYLIEDMGRELPPSAGSQHESGASGPNNAGPGQIDIHIFRITARATGGNPNTARALQSTFDAQANN